MRHYLKLSLMAVAAVLAMALPAAAQESSGFSMDLRGAFGTGILIFGAAMGIGKIGAAAVESMARQPEVAGDIRGAMIVAAALIEGATFFGLIVIMIVEWKI